MIRSFGALLVGVVLFLNVTARAGILKPGFDADEYLHVLLRCSNHADSMYRGNLPVEQTFDRVYRSAVVGLHNRWALWLSKDRTVMTVNLRGTTKDPDSWLENFYSAMIPATGSLKLNDSTTFQYKFANDAKAMVHVGWTIGACSMLPDIIRKVKEQYANGVKQLIVEGHSQGGSLAYLVSAHLRYEIAAGRLPKDLVIKVYCSAAPKPGNLYFAYDFDFANRNGWAFTVVNAADWVPETPVTIQTTKEFNPTNPLVGAKAGIRKQKFIIRLFVMHAYNKLVRSARRNQKVYGRYLGKVMGKQIKKYLPQYEVPEYSKCGNFMRAGTFVVLQPDAAYYGKYPDGGQNVFIHHMFAPYYDLVNTIYK